MGNWKIRFTGLINFFECCNNLNNFLKNEENLYFENKTKTQEFLKKKNIIIETTSLIKEYPYLINHYTFTGKGRLMYNLTKPIRYFL